jgi:hypothetical protein
MIMREMAKVLMMHLHQLRRRRRFRRREQWNWIISCSLLRIQADTLWCDQCFSMGRSVFSIKKRALPCLELAVGFSRT